MAHNNGLSAQPEVIAELGPGDSLGIGLAALLSGANTYYAFDVVSHASNKRNIEVFDDLVILFKHRMNIPDDTRFPLIKPRLDSYNFPHHILTEERLTKALRSDRLESIRNALLHLNRNVQSGIQISYIVPWHAPTNIAAESVDLILSQAVLEYPNDLSFVYENMYCWLKSGGYMSHQIDFKCHGTASKWNGHWTYSDFVWKLMRGMLNRAPHSTHIDLLQRFNFEIVCDIKVEESPGISRRQLANKFKDLLDDDLTTSGAFIQAVKKA